MITPIILAGGSGSRLWPLSRLLYPKQFLRLHGKYSMLQDTLLRLQGLNVSKPILVCNEQHRFLAAEQMREIDYPCTILLESEGKNTAPAIALAAFVSLQNANNTELTLLVLSADHCIADMQAFTDSIELAEQQCKQGKIVTFGVDPASAHTGYGYIQKGKPLQNGKAFCIKQFVEKPNKETAVQYVQSGNYFWNSGMFMFKADVLLTELKKYHSEIYDCCLKASTHFTQDVDFIRVNNLFLKNCPNESIDYAVMEHTRNAVVVALNSAWSDIGCWSSLWEIKAKDDQGNACKGDVLLQNSQNCLVHSEYRMIAAIGLKDLIIVETHDAVLVVNKNDEQQVKTVVEKLKKQNKHEYLHHREVYRPWGKYDSIDSGNRYQVKHITVKPGEKLSIQKHLHRAEHWTVVRGTAHVTNADQELLLTENQSTYIPVGTIHCLENRGKIPLEIIEVQSGAYLGEDDIIRLEDRYGRVKTDC